jgi:hypothetical protein
MNFSKTEKEVISANYNLFQKVITDALTSVNEKDDINNVIRFHLDCILESKED